MTGPPRRGSQILWAAFVGLCLQVPLALWIDYQIVLVWAGAEPLGYRWRAFVLIAAAAFLVQLCWLLPPRWAERYSSRYIWLAVFWALAFFEFMAGD
jgi:hypothetical protein